MKNLKNSKNARFFSHKALTNVWQCDVGVDNAMNMIKLFN